MGNVSSMIPLSTQTSGLIYNTLRRYKLMGQLNEEAVTINLIFWSKNLLSLSNIYLAYLLHHKHNQIQKISNLAYETNYVSPIQ